MEYSLFSGLFGSFRRPNPVLVFPGFLEPDVAIVQIAFPGFRQSRGLPVSPARRPLGFRALDQEAVRQVHVHVLRDLQRLRASAGCRQAGEAHARPNTKSIRQNHLESSGLS